MDSTVKQSVKHQRVLLTHLLGGTLVNLAVELVPLMNDSDLLNNHLRKAIGEK